MDNINRKFIFLLNDYIVLSIETHLFFARIMKEHSLFLEAGFPCCEKEFIEEAHHFRCEFEELLRDTLEIADGVVQEPILRSSELVTEFTVCAEEKTETLSGIPIDSNLTGLAQRLRCGCIKGEISSLYQTVIQINERALNLLTDLICFKERILNRVNNAQLFTVNYPLLIEHITREARLYRDIVEQLMTNRSISYQNLYETENFWNRIMMEHAWFIRGLLDPSEAQLIETADSFSKDYSRLLHEARKQNCRANAMTEKSLEETLKYRDFKATGTKGILDCQISSIILPLLADHVLREANHYIRMLETGRTR
ncbi:DUF2935 domain-containing protein [Sporofaciens sp. SGI.106]|uniref:DUF2935 domain-containing protein n=1 Tax=Sporofaciens sp. SGI.106 TaxID=3420568 RepID=UPI003D04CE8E